MHPLERKTLESITGTSLIETSVDRVVVAVSGGPDSMALLHVLSRLRDPLAVSLVAVYVDHGLRPDETGAEQELVGAAAAALKVPFVACKRNVEEEAWQTGKSIEHAGRDLRYQALRSVAAEHGAAVIAVAHTADDQAEEILIRLLRAGGRKALAGMRIRSQDIIRPFLRFSKDEILAFLHERDISYVLDSSNEDRRYLRNRVRLELLPFLEEHFDQGIRKALCKTADSLAEDEALLEELTDQGMAEVVLAGEAGDEEKGGRVVLDRDGLLRQPLALQRRIIEKLLWDVGGRASYAHILTILDAAAGGRTGTERHLSRGLRLGVTRSTLELLFPHGKKPWRGRLYPD